jgi:hypothetical protein
LTQVRAILVHAARAPIAIGVCGGANRVAVGVANQPQCRRKYLVLHN